MTLRWSGLWAMALMLAGCGADQPYERTYAIPYDEARVLMAEAKLPQLMFGSTDPVRQSVDTDDPAKLVYFVGRDGAEVMHYVVTTAAVAPKSTRITLTLQGPDTGKFAGARERLVDNPKVRKLYEAAMAEAIAAKLERREYRMTEVYPSMMQATFEQMPRLRADLDRAEDAHRQQVDDDIAKAYRDEYR